MTDLTLILVTALMTLIVFGCGWIAQRWWLSKRTPSEVRGEKRCSLCNQALGVDAVRSHVADGQWLYRCARHKGQP